MESKSLFVTFKDLKANISPTNPTLIAALLALGAGFVWATSTSFSKMVLSKVSFTTTTWLRFLIAPIFALLITLGMGQQSQLSAITIEQWKSLAIITLSTGMVALLIYYYGLRKTPARVSAICELTWPASAIVIDYFMYKSTFTMTQIIGVIVLFVSMYKVSKFKNA
jgi:drug/metabolite transporter (DMT)-like permease